MFEQVPQGFLIVGAAVLGAVIGSFVGAVLVRLPQGQSVVHGRSKCDHCGKLLSPLELVPIFSFLAQRGKCRGCGGAIGGWALASEVAGSVIGVGAVLWARDGLTLAAMILGWQLLLLALLDLRHFWLPRALTGLLAASGAIVVAIEAWVMGTIDPLLISVSGGAMGFVMLWAIARFYRRARGREGMGAGDPPLLGAIGLWLGPLGVVEVMLGASILGIVAAIVMLVSKRKIAADTALPLGTCLAATAWPIFLVQGLG